MPNKWYVCCASFSRVVSLQRVNPNAMSAVTEHPSDLTASGASSSSSAPLQNTDTDTVQTAAELILAELGPYHTREVYRNALRVALKNATEESVAFFYGGELVGTQHLELVWRRYSLEVECLARASAASAASQHDNCYMRARTCHKDVMLVKFSPSSVSVFLYGAPAQHDK